MITELSFLGEVDSHKCFTVCTIYGFFNQITVVKMSLVHVETDRVSRVTLSATEY